MDSPWNCAERDPRSGVLARGGERGAFTGSDSTRSGH